MDRSFKRKYIRETLKQVTDKVTGTQQPYIVVKAPTTGPYHNLPDICFFDPLSQLGLKLKCKHKNKEHENAFIVVTDLWSDFGSQDPRLIISLAKNAYLVVRLYKCLVCDKRIKASNPRFLSQLPAIPPFDFVLYHQSAVATVVYNEIVLDAVNGVPFSRTAKKFEEHKKIEFSQHMTIEEKLNNEKMEEDTTHCMHATHVGDIFLHFFRRHQSDFVAEFKSVQCQEVSIDHTFYGCRTFQP